MPSTLGLTAAWLPIVVEPGDALDIDVTVGAGITGTWAAKVYASARRGTPLATFTPSYLGSVVTLFLSSTATAGLVPAGNTRFTGHWDLTCTNNGEQTTWLKGGFVADAAFVRTT